jgi:hypothetical protein
MSHIICWDFMCFDLLLLTFTDLSLGPLRIVQDESPANVYNIQRSVTVQACGLVLVGV